MAITIAATATTFAAATSAAVSFTDGFGSSLWLLAFYVPNGSSITLANVPTGTQPWVLSSAANANSALYWLNGAGCPIQLGNILATLSWTGSSRAIIAVVQIDGCGHGLDGATNTTYVGATSIPALGLNPTGKTDALLTIALSNGAVASNTYTLPSFQTQDAFAQRNDSGPLTISGVVSHDILTDGQVISGVTAANPMVLTVVDTTGVVDNTTQVRWAGFGGADAAYLNTTNPTGIVTAHTGTTLTIGAISTSGKTLTTDRTTKIYTHTPQTGLTNPQATGTRAISQSSAMNTSIWTVALRDAANDTTGLLLPAGVDAIPSIPNKHSGSSSILHKDIGFGGAQMPARVQFPNTNGLWKGIAGPWASFSGSYKVSGMPSDITAGVSENSTPAAKRVLLRPRYHPEMVPLETYSLTDGSYEFLYLAPGLYDVEGWDQNQVKNGVVRHMVTALPMNPIV